jgi:hypothetical protein
LILDIEMGSVASVVETVLAHLSPVGWRFTVPTPYFNYVSEKRKGRRGREKQSKEIFG